MILLFFFPKLRVNVGNWKILLLGLLAWVPDLDIILFGAHRFMLHNIFVVLIVFLLFYFVFGRLIGLLSLYFVGSHLLFDLSKPGIAILYPFTSKLVYLDIIISETNKWLLSIDYGILDSVVINPYWPHTYLQQYGSLVLILIGVLFVVKGFINVRKGRSFWKVF